jgi:UPF0288 family protein (methanogenesis marker protein 3)
MTTIAIRIDGKESEITEGMTLGRHSLRDARCSAAVIRPVARESSETSSYRIISTKGELTMEIFGERSGNLDPSAFSHGFRLQWEDRYAAAFGPFSSDIKPARTPHIYNRGDVILGCGGYDPKHSFLIFSRMRHSADFGAPADGGVIGQVTSGRVLDAGQPETR